MKEIFQPVKSSQAGSSVETLRSQHSVAGFVFDQKGIMGGVSVKGTKFSRITPD